MFVRTTLPLLVFCLAATAPRDARAQDAPSSESALDEARARIARGEALFARGDFDAALVELEAAYALAEGHPVRHVILYNVAQCHERSFRYDLAIRYYERYLREGGPDVEDRSAVEATLRTLDAMLGTVAISANTNAEVWIDGREVGEAPGSVRVPPGRHRVELRALGYETAVAEVDVPARTTRALRLSLEPLARDYEGIDPLPFWLTAGAAVLVTGIGGGLAISTRIDRDDIDARLADPVQRWSVTQSERSSLESRAIAADVMFGTGAALAATAVVLAVLTDWSSEDVEVAPQVGSANGLVMRGAF